MPRTPIRPERAAADRQACRSLQDRHCRGELARTQLPSQAGDVLKGLQREASRNVQSRRYVSVRRCAYVPAVTTDKEPVPQLSEVTRQLMIDVSRLHFADSAAIALLLPVAKTVRRWQRLDASQGAGRPDLADRDARRGWPCAVIRARALAARTASASVLMS